MGPNEAKWVKWGMHAYFYEMKKSCLATKALRQKLAELWGFCRFQDFDGAPLKTSYLFLYLSEGTFFIPSESLFIWLYFEPVIMVSRRQNSKFVCCIIWYSCSEGFQNMNIFLSSFPTPPLHWKKMLIGGSQNNIFWSLPETQRLGGDSDLIFISIDCHEDKCIVW